MKTEVYKERILEMTVAASGTLHDGVTAIASGMLGTALVVDPETNRFVGLITDGDIRRKLISGGDSSTPISEIVNRDAVTVDENTSGEDIADLFSPVVRVIPILNDSQEVVDLAVFDKRINLPVAEPYLTDKELGYVTDCIVSGWISSGGKYVNKFETMVAESCNVSHGISTTSGTTALHLALLACGIGPGDEVIVPTMTFVAPASTACHVGAKPIFVDVEETTMCLDPDQLLGAITPRTKAIIPVHLYGHPANMDSIMEIADQYDLWVIEDAAEAQGAEYRGKPVGSLGHAAIFSFFGNKTITTGEGGMVLTNDDLLAQKMRLFRDHGMDRSQGYWHPVIGFNYRMTNIQAAIGVGQMENFDTILQKKRIVASTYHQLLADIKSITLPTDAPWATSSCWLYTILLNGLGGKSKKNDLLEELRKENVEARSTFIPMHRQPIFEESRSYPVADHISDNGISLPTFATLKYEDIDKICNVIKATVGT